MRRAETQKYDRQNFDLDEYHRVLGLTFRCELVLCTIYDGELKLLMIERDQPPFLGDLVFPGGYLREDLSADETAKAICSKLELTVPKLTHFDIFSGVDRDRRSRTISAGYLGIVTESQLIDIAGVRSRFRLVTVDWEGLHPKLLYQYEKVSVGFDHLEIATSAVRYLRAMLDNSNIAFQFLPKEFSLMALQRIHEIIDGKPLEKMRFRKRMVARIFPGNRRLRAIGETVRGKGRPAELYQLSQVEP